MSSLQNMPSNPIIRLNQTSPMRVGGNSLEKPKLGGSKKLLETSPDASAPKYE